MIPFKITIDHIDLSGVKHCNLYDLSDPEHLQLFTALVHDLGGSGLGYTVKEWFPEFPV
jgi:hypothetical protein